MAWLGAGLVLAGVLSYCLVPLDHYRFIEVRLDAEYQGRPYTLGGRVLCSRTHFVYGGYNPDIWYYTPTPRVFAQELPDGSLLLLRNTAKFCGPEARPWDPAWFEDFLPVVEWYDSAETPERGRAFLSARIATDYYGDLSLRDFAVTLEDDAVSRFERWAFLDRYEETAATFDRTAIVTQHEDPHDWARHPALIPLKLDPRSIPAVREIASHPGKAGRRFVVIPRCTKEARPPSGFSRRYVMRGFENGIDLVEKPYPPHHVPANRRADYDGVVPLIRTDGVWRAGTEALGAVEMMPGFLDLRVTSNSAPAIVEWAGETLEIHPYELVYDRRDDRVYLLEGKWTYWPPAESRDCRR